MDAITELVTAVISVGIQFGTGLAGLILQMIQSLFFTESVALGGYDGLSMLGYIVALFIGMGITYKASNFALSLLLRKRLH